MKLIVSFLLFALPLSLLAQKVPLTCIEMDAYPVPAKWMQSDTIAHLVICDGIYSYDRVWFKSEKHGVGLIIDLATDYHHLREIRFDLHNLPSYFIEELYFNDSIGNLTTLEQNIKAIPCFLSKAKYLNYRYFHSEKGILLGKEISVLIKTYGEPTASFEKDGYTIYKWTYLGDQLEDPETLAPGFILAKDSYGYEVTAIFQKDVLVGHMIFKDIP